MCKELSDITYKIYMQDHLFWLQNIECDSSMFVGSSHDMVRFCFEHLASTITSKNSTRFKTKLFPCHMFPTQWIGPFAPRATDQLRAVRLLRFFYQVNLEGLSAGRLLERCDAMRYARNLRYIVQAWTRHQYCYFGAQSVRLTQEDWVSALPGHLRFGCERRSWGIGMKVRLKSSCSVRWRDFETTR